VGDGGWVALRGVQFDVDFADRLGLLGEGSNRADVPVGSGQQQLELVPYNAVHTVDMPTAQWLG
jgi:hypothetical protein